MTDPLLVCACAGRLYVKTLGRTRAEQSLLSGQMLSPAEALAGGMLHQLVPKAALMAEAEKALGLYLRSPDAGRIATKVDARGFLAKQWQAYCDEEARAGWKSQQHSSAQLIRGLHR